MYHKHFKSELFILVIFQLGINPLRWNTRYQNNTEKIKSNKHTTIINSKD